MKLPEHPSKEDFFAVLRSVAKGVAPTAQDLISAYGMGRSGSLNRMIDTLEDACLLAVDAGRRSVTAKDVLSAVDARTLSDSAIERPAPLRNGGPGAGDGPEASAPPIPGDEPRASNSVAPLLPGGRSTAAYPLIRNALFLFGPVGTVPRGPQRLSLLGNLSPPAID